MSSAPQRRKWPASDVAYLRTNARTLTLHQMAEHLGRTFFQVECKMTREKIKYGTFEFVWTPAREAKLRSLLGKQTCQQIAETLGTTYHVVKRHGERERLSFARTKKPKPVQVKPEVVRVKSDPPTRVCEIVGRLTWCPTCHAPVSNWQEHKERMGCSWNRRAPQPQQ